MARGVGVPDAHDDGGADAGLAEELAHRFVDAPFLSVPGRAGIVEHLSVVQVQDGIGGTVAVAFGQPDVDVAWGDEVGGEIGESFDRSTIGFLGDAGLGGFVILLLEWWCF